MIRIARSFARNLSLAIVVALLGSLQVSVASADTIVPENGYYDCETGTNQNVIDSNKFSIRDGGVHNVNCHGPVVLPEGVTSIEDQGFAYSQVTSINIPSSVATIGYGAFAASSSASITIDEGLTTIAQSAFRETKLTSIIIPSSVATIGNSAFYMSSINSVTLPEGLTSIPDGAFESTALTAITIPSSVATIGYGAFRFTALTSLNIPAGVTSIGKRIVDGVATLTTISVDPANQNYTAPDGVLHDKNETTIIAYPAGKAGSSYSIKDTVTSIGEDAFSGATSLTTVNIPSTVTSIGDGAFSGATALTSVDIPAGITFIGDETFEGTAIASITIPAGVTGIGYGAFSGATALTTVNIPPSVTYLDDGAFYGATALTSVDLPESLTSIGYSAFAGATSLTSIVIPAGVTYINDEAFSGATSLMDVTFLGDVPSDYFGYDVFYNHPEGAKVHISATATGFGTEATWEGLVIERAAKPSYVSGAKYYGRAVVGGKPVKASPGDWNGTAPISFTYQWYACKSASKKVLRAGKVAPTCFAVKNAQNPTFKATSKQKGRFLAVLITATNDVGRSRIFTTTSGKVS